VQVQGPLALLNGKPVQFRHCPAAVMGAKSARLAVNHALFSDEWEAAPSRRPRVRIPACAAPSRAHTCRLASGNGPLILVPARRWFQF